MGLVIGKFGKGKDVERFPVRDQSTKTAHTSNAMYAHAKFETVVLAKR